MRAILMLFILRLLARPYMIGTTKTVADYKGMSREELEALRLKKG